MVKVYVVQTFGGDSYYVTPKQYEMLKKMVEKKSSDGFMLGDSYVRASSIKQMDGKNMEVVDLPIYCREKLKKEGVKLLEWKENLGSFIGTTYRYYDEYGNEIKKPQQIDKDPPKRFALIKRNQYRKWVAGENGGSEETIVEGKIIEQVFYNTIKEDGYYDFCVVLTIDREGIIRIDRMPDGWDFRYVPGIK